MSISSVYKYFVTSPQQKITTFFAGGLLVLLVAHPALYSRQIAYIFVGCVCFIAWILALLITRGFQCPPATLCGGATFLLANAGISLLVQVDPRWFVLVLLGIQLFFCFAGWWLAADLKALRLWCYILVLGAAGVAGYGICQFLHLDPLPVTTPFKERTVSVFVNPNHFGSFMALTLPLALGFYLQNLTGWMRLFTVLTVVLLYAGLLLSGSRGAWAGAGVGVLIVFVGCLLRLPRCDRAYLVRPLIGLFALICIITWSLNYKPIMKTAGKAVTMKERALSSKNVLGAGVEQDSSINHRYFIWRVSWDMIRSAPWTGIGYGKYQEYFPQFRDSLKAQSRFSSLNIGQQQEITPYAHNEYLHWWAENGLLGLFGFLYLVIMGLAHGISTIWKTKNYAALGWGSLGLLAALLVHSMVSYPLRLPLNSLSFWLILGALYRKEK